MQARRWFLVLVTVSGLLLSSAALAGAPGGADRANKGQTVSQVAKGVKNTPKAPVDRSVKKTRKNAKVTRKAVRKTAHQKARAGTVKK